MKLLAVCLLLQVGPSSHRVLLVCRCWSKAPLGLLCYNLHGTHAWNETEHFICAEPYERREELMFVMIMQKTTGYLVFRPPHHFYSLCHILLSL